MINDRPKQIVKIDEVNRCFREETYERTSATSTQQDGSYHVSWTFWANVCRAMERDWYRNLVHVEKTNGDTKLTFPRQTTSNWNRMGDNWHNNGKCICLRVSEVTCCFCDRTIQLILRTEKTFSPRFHEVIIKMQIEHHRVRCEWKGCKANCYLS